MDVRLATAINPALKRVEKASQETAPVIGYLLTPIAFAGYVLAFWRLLSDLGWVGEFFISRGLLSHWQVWVALAVGIHSLATFLNRTGSPDDSVLS